MQILSGGREKIAMAKSGIPAEFGEQLARLTPGLTLIVSKDLLQTWFPSEKPSRDLDKQELAAAANFAERFGCVFHYFPLGGASEEGEGRFRKQQKPQAT